MMPAIMPFNQTAMVEAAIADGPLQVNCFPALKTAAAKKLKNLKS
jgi:hypothetical protein